MSDESLNGSDTSLHVFDCSLARCATGRSCSNLRELLDAVRTVPDPVIEHHMMRCALEDRFELDEFPNEFARWCWESLGDHLLGEQLALIDPYQHRAMSGVRGALEDALEERLWGLDRVPWCRSGLELPLIESRLIAYDTGDRIETPAELAEALLQLSPRSLFYHVHEARRRTKNGADDFSNWLESLGVDESLVARLRSMDFYFFNLNQLRREILEILRDYLQHSLTSAPVSV